MEDIDRASRTRRRTSLNLDPHTTKLAEYLSSVASLPDEGSLLREGVELAADAAGAHTAAFLRGSALLAGDACDEPGHHRIEIDAGAETLSICSPAPFGDPEQRLARAIARILSLTLTGVRAAHRERAARRGNVSREVTNARQLAELIERQSLFERLGKVQRAISRARSMREVAQSVVNGARSLFGDELASLRIVDPEDQRFTLLIGSSGIAHGNERLIGRLPIGRTIGCEAILQNQLVVEESDREPSLEFGDAPYRAMSAPIHGSNSVIGSFVVGTHRADRRYSATEREAFVALCESASLAITDARLREESLERALHDPLTGLPNRELFADSLSNALSVARRADAGVGMLFIDIDRFKIVNDGFGHAAGDEVLQQVGERLRACMRAGDIAARFGADEFGLLIEDAASPAAVLPVAERVLHRLRAPFMVGGREVMLGASIGIVVAGKRATADETLRNAAVAVHEAKTMGRGQIAIFEPDMHERLVARVELQSDLQRSLASEQFVVHYQPVVALDTGAIKGFEALVRWQHPTRGLLGPDEFVPLAEEMGIVAALDRWVMKRAARDLAEWQQLTGCAALSVSVNLSARDFSKPGLAAAVSEAARGLPAGCLVLEITESALLESGAFIATLKDLRDAGVRIAVDDFGTGYSSLSYLHRFPIDVLKIDRAFIEGIAGDVEESALARAVLRIGSALGVETIAEGVENEEQRTVLMSLGCMLAQGFLFSQAVPASQVPALLAEHGTRRLRSVG